ncbi:MAG TPA: DUF6416 domain-containing protein [Solirubrobacterales bacterium]|nr:DUF6416 domain-containing protein [Solirubrobacterales bacterium]
MSEYVPVPVPPDRVEEVYKLLAHPPADVSPEHEYDEVTVQKLYDESAPGLQRVLKHLMCYPGELVPADDLVERAGVADGRAFGGILGAFSKRCQSRYGRGLPFEIRTVGDRGFYVMSERMAAMINRAR